MERGEQLCGGVCVNTQWDHEHCGMCFKVCPEFTGCSEGECVMITPYGAPMPDPIWA